MQDNKQPVNPVQSTGSLVPDIVKEIPVASPDSKPKLAGEDDELDNIMRDIGHDLKQVGQKKPKHRWFDKQKKDKAEPKFSARPIDQVRPLPAAPPPKSAAPAQAPAPAKPATLAKAKPTKDSHSPVGVVVLAMFVTVGLIAAAYYAYK
jgi:hypothetical protein